MNFSKDNNTKTVGPFIPFHCVEILLYKKCTKSIYELFNKGRKYTEFNMQMKFDHCPNGLPRNYLYT